MSRKLIISNTYFQLIVAIQLKCTIFSSDEVVLLLSDHSKGTEIICEKIKQLNLFEEIHYIKSKDKRKKINLINYIQDFFDLTLGKRNRFVYYLNGINNVFFDEIVIYNFDRDVVCLYSYLYEFNKKIIISFYEEGILSYNFGVLKRISDSLTNFARSILNKNNAFRSFRYFYCFYPSLYNGNLLALELPIINGDCKCKDILLNLFSDKIIDVYKNKYIFFTSVYDFEGGEPIGEFEIVKKVQDIIGKENLLIKVHPRDYRNIYNQSCFNIDCNSDIPWEVIQLSYDFSDKVFLTLTSGSVLAGSLMADKPVRIYYLYNLCTMKNNPNAERSVQMIENLVCNENMREYFKNVNIIKSLQEIVDENT